MIRRAIQLPDAKPQWLLVSQLEHARVSGQLVEAAIHSFPSEGGSGSDTTIQQIRDEIVRAIYLHDDGWAEWEASPRLDVEGKPPSFTEMEQSESLVIWTRCVERAEEVGPLAAWMVAKHFLELLDNSSEGHSAPAEQWRQFHESMAAERLADWRFQDSIVRSERRADEALGLLQVFDLFSLWLCLRAPVSGEVVAERPEPYRLGRQPVFEIAALDPQATAAFGGDPVTTVQVEPWCFDRSMLIEISGHLVEQRAYHDTTDLLTSRRPCLERVRLCPCSDSR